MFITLLAVFLLTAAICTLIFLYLRNRALSLELKTLRNQTSDLTRLHREAAELKLLSLKSQVNPHFLFNCLNGIHNAVITGETPLAQAYISGVAQLLRRVLMLADKHLISLKEETDLLEIYLQLELLRTSNGFDYVIEVDPPVNPMIPVPSMLIQPFVENAIWHGLMPKKDNRLLKIHWQYLKTNLYACEITDNGIGRLQSRSRHPEGLKSGNYRSKGLDICMERISLYQSLYQTQYSIRIDDLPEGQGTRVYITFETTAED